jgi:hypothetical protein
MTATTTTLTVHPIDQDRLDAIRAAGEDDGGNPLTPFAATGEGEPLRCCLRFARPRESLALISYAPFEKRRHGGRWGRSTCTPSGAAVRATPVCPQG